MFSPDDTIVAIATPPGRGGIGVVRISGPSTIVIARAILGDGEALEPRRATFTHVRSAASADFLDEVVATSFPSPHSYTGQDVVEISAHGSPVILQAIVRSAVSAGARLAEPGEFTLRAFLNGKRDLIQAEAVADLIEAATPLQARIAFDQLEGTLTRRIGAIDGELFDLIARLEASLDFPEEGYHFIESSDAASSLERLLTRFDHLLADAARGQMIREGATVVIVGRPNVGKSSVFNALVGTDRAIVTNVPGTTRDLITERVDIDGLPLTLVDTAGWRNTFDIVEREGVTRGARARGVADVIVVVLDGSEPLTDEDRHLVADVDQRRRIVIRNKADRPACWCDAAAGHNVIRTSAITSEGLEELRRAIVYELAGRESLRDGAAVSNARHIALLEDARTRVASAQRAAASGDTPEEFVLTDLQAARMRLEEIVGARTTDDLLQHIFERFCVGK
jgi:tRNA modification GTPase